MHCLRHDDQHSATSPNKCTHPVHPTEFCIDIVNPGLCSRDFITKQWKTGHNTAVQMLSVASLLVFRCLAYHMKSMGGVPTGFKAAVQEAARGVLPISVSYNINDWRDKLSSVLKAYCLVDSQCEMHAVLAQKF